MKSKTYNLFCVLIVGAMFLAIFPPFGFVSAPGGQQHNIWGNAEHGPNPGNKSATSNREITTWIDGMTYGSNFTLGSGQFDLYVDGDFWGIPQDDAVKDGGWEGDLIQYFLDYDPMNYYLNISTTTSIFNTSAYENVDIYFDTETYWDLSLGDTYLRGLKINEIVLEPGDGFPQYVYIYDPQGELSESKLEDAIKGYYLQKDDNINHDPDGPIFDFSLNTDNVVRSSPGSSYYYINLTGFSLNSTADELKLVWRNPGTSSDNIANGTDVIVDRVEWGNYVNHINGTNPPNDRDYDNTTLWDCMGFLSTGQSFIRIVNGSDTDNCLFDFTIQGTATGRSAADPVWTVDYIEITYTPDGVPIAGKVVNVGYQEWGYCSAYNTTAGYLGLMSADWTAEGGNSNLLNSTPQDMNGIYVGTMGATVWFNASYSGHADSVQYTVLPPTADYIRITDVPDGVALGGGTVLQGYQEWGNCSAYNTTVGYLGTVSADWTAEGGISTLLGVTPAVFNGIDVGIIGGVSVWLNATYSSLTDSVQYSVTPWTVDFIEITNFAGGTNLSGGIVPPNFVEYGNSSVYNTTGGYICTVDADWTVQGGTATLVGPTPADSNGIDVGASIATVWLNASYTGHTDSVQYTVTPPTVDYVRITYSPGGTQIPDKIVSLGYQESGNCSSYNNTAGYIGTVSADWTAVGGSSFLLGPTPAHGNVIDVGTNAGTVWFNASYSGHTDSVEYTAGNITIDYLEITDSPNGTPLTGGSVSIDFQEYAFSSAYNNTIGYINTVLADWTAEGGNSYLLNSTPTTFNGINVGTISGPVWLNISYAGKTDSVVYNVGNLTVDFIDITDIPDGTPLIGGSVPPGYQAWGNCSAYNITAGYLGTVSADWTATGGSAFLLGSTPNTMNGIDVGTTPGTVWFNANFGVHSDSVQYTISVDIDYIEITDFPGGTPLPGGVVPPNYEEWGNCSAYNTTTGYLYTVEADWYVSGADPILLGSTPAYGNGINVGSVLWYKWLNASYGGHTDGVQYLVSSPTVDFMAITIPPGGVPLIDRTVPQDYQEWGYASLFNSTFGYIDLVSANWTAQGGSASLLNSTPNTLNGIDVGTIPGAVWFNASISGFSDSVLYTVSIDTIDYLEITNTPGGTPLTGGTVNPGYEEWGNCSAYNSSSGYLYTVNADWTVEGGAAYLIGPTQGHGSGINVGSTTGVSVWFNASYGGHTNSVVYSVNGSVTVDYIFITDTPGGTILGNKVVQQGYQEWGYCSAYNTTVGYIGLVDGNWLATGGNATLLGATPATTNGIDVGSQTGIVYLRCNYSGYWDEVEYTVTSAPPPTVDYIVIMDASGGGGNWVGDSVYNMGETDTFYAAGYNLSSGYIGDFSVTWSSSDPSVGTVTTPGTSTTFNAVNGGTCVVTVDYGGGITNDTGTLTVIKIDFIQIRDAPGGFGSIIGDKTYIVYETDTFYAVAYNYTFGWVMDVSASWVCNDTNVGTVTTPGVNVTFTAQWVQSDSTCQVVATYTTISNTTGILTVHAPRADYIQIRSADGGGGAEIISISYQKGATDTYYGAAYNNTVDYYGSVPLTSTWISSDTSIVDVTSPGNYSDITCSNTNGGTVTVTLNDGFGNTYVTTVTVLNWTVDYILIRDSPSGGGVNLSDPLNYPTYPVGHETTFYGALYNDTAGYIGDVASISTWTSNNTNIVDVISPGYSSILTCSNTNFGIVEITLEEWMGFNTTTQVTVLEPTIDYIIIRDAGGGGGNVTGTMVYEVGETDTFYAAAYNNTANYLRDVSCDWSSDDTGVGTVTTPGSSTTFTAVGMGTCTVTAEYDGGTFTDTTGLITVNLPSNITVRGSGGAHFTTIQEAINNANNGDTVFVYSGIYHEHLMIDKSITLMGEDKDTTIIDGDGYGKVIFVLGDNVSISGFTIQDGEYGIYCLETDSTSITYNIIQDYDYGIYCNQTTGGYIARNTITDGQYGIVTFEAYNDAIRYNTISYNTEYGAKDYNSQLENCFNWNYFHNNTIAYYYDPDTPLSVLEFDGNILEDNYIAIMVENASTISITNNTMNRNEYGIYLIKASPNISDNSISTSDYGIYGEGSSPTISDNMISEISRYGIYARSGDSLRIINNTLTDSRMIFIDSIIKELWLKDSDITKINTTVEDSHLDSGSVLEIQWLLRIRVVDDTDEPVEDAAVLVYDVYDTLVFTHVTDSEGWTDWIPVIESSQTSTSSTVYNPYRIRIIKNEQTKSQSITMSEDTELVIYLEIEEPIITPSETVFPWGLIILVGFIGAFGVAGLSLEVFKYGLLTLFLPLYSRIKREKLLDQPTRERIYGYIIGNPGAYFGLIKDDLDLGSGQLVYHLKQLEEAHLIYSKEDGVKKRFYPSDIPKAKKGSPNLSSLQEKILGIIEDNSGIHQKKIAKSIGISRQVAGYHLTKMERKGIIGKEIVGRETKYYASKRYSV